MSAPVETPDPTADEALPSPVPPAAELPELRTELADLRTALAELRAEVARDHERAAAREHAIDRLHDENERLRAGERQLLLRPVLTDLQRLRHELLRAVDQLPELFSGQQAGELLRSYAYNLELTLERGGIEVVSPRAGEPLDPAAHRVTGTVPAAEAGQDATVAEVVLDGYRDVPADRVVSPAAVRVYRWTSPEQPPIS
jgi:molecular chaperone GrpE